MEAVPGMHFEAKTARERGAVTDAMPFCLRRVAPALAERIAPRAGMDLDHRSANARRALDLPRLGGDEEGDADAGIDKPGDDRRQHVVLAGDIEPAFSRSLLAALRDKAGGMRFGLQRDRDHLICRRHLEIDRL
jgi:hypothetical protein